MNLLFLRLRARLWPAARAEAELAFDSQAGPLASGTWLVWLPGFCLVAAALVFFWLAPVGGVEGGWPAALQGRWSPAAECGVLVCLPVLVELLRARRCRHQLAAAYAAADVRLGGTFLRNPNSLMGSAALLVAAYLPGLDILAWIGAGLAAQAATELAVRLLIAPGRRVHLAGRVIGRGLGSHAVVWLAAAALAVWLAPTPGIRPPTRDDLAVAVRTDPAVRAADAAIHEAFATARTDSIAPYDLRQLISYWDGSHVTDGTIPAALKADEVMLDRLRAFTAFWTEERKRPYDAADLAGRCEVSPPALPCRIQQAPRPVQGSDGGLLYRVTRRADLPQETTFADGLLIPDAMDVFQAAEPGAWHHVLHVAYDPGGTQHQPQQIATPAGTLLLLPPVSRWSIQVGDIEGGDQAYLRRGTTWRRIDTASWLKQAAAALPPHQCLLQTVYSVSNEPLATDLEPDYRILTLLGRYGPQAGNVDRVSGSVAFSFAIEDDVLVLRHAVLTPYADHRTWWKRWLERGPGC